MKKIKCNLVSKTNDTRLYKIPVPIIGLTGGIATGKSTVANILRQNGIAVLDADALVKSIYKKPETINFISKNFPSAMVNNQIDFKILRQIAFSNEISKENLENYIYTHLPNTFLEAYKALPSQAFIVYDVPLLFEKGLDKLVDLTVCVYSPKELQIKRLMARDQISVELSESILKNQWPIELKKEKSQFVLSNLDSLDDLNKEINLFLNNILE